MTSKTIILLATIALSITAIDPVLASMRCGTHIISAGQPNAPGKYEVLKRCGEPTQRYGDTWVYEKSSSVSRELRFDRDGRLMTID